MIRDPKSRPHQGDDIDKSIENFRRNVVSIQDDGRTFRGYYQLQGGRLLVWALGEDGSVEGPYAVAMVGTDWEAVARILLQDHIDGLDGRRRTKRITDYD